MNHKENKAQPLTLSGLNFLAVILLCTILFSGAISTAVRAEVEVSFLYSLSNFSGPIPSRWATVSVDEMRNEVYLVDIRERDVKIFNSRGMEVYRFGDDGSLGTVVDVAVKRDGNILVLSRVGNTSAIMLCNFRAEPIEKLELKKLPSDFSGFSADRMVYRQELLYLLDKRSMNIAVTDTNGLFQKGYHVAPLVLEEKDRLDATEMEGFSVDRKGNMLFTIPVKFLAYRLSPDGEIASFGRPGGGPGRFNVVGGIVADERGYYYVADRLKSAVLIFDKDFQFQTEFGYRGSRADNLIGPRNLALDGEGRLYVSQLERGGVSVFKITYK